MTLTPLGQNNPMAPQNPISRREIRSERVQYKFRPSLASAVQHGAEREGISETSFAERALEKEASKIPIVGEIPCGEPGEIADDSIEAWVNVGDLLKTRPGDLLLRASGDSMQGGGVSNGDLVLIRPQSSCDSGEICAVLLDGPMGTRATLKKVVFSDASPIVKLVPMNDAHETIEIDTKQQLLRICGVKKGVIKNH